MKSEFSITIRFYEELNDLLKVKNRKRDISVSYNGKRSVKDLIESFNVPHTEVDLILVNGESRDFGYILNDNDRVSVYPVFESFDIKHETHLREKPLRESRFIADHHLRKLSRLLRIAGFDTLYMDKSDRKKIILISEEEKRIIITGSAELLKQKDATRAVLTKKSDPTEQFIEVVKKLQLENEIKPFSRCMECNGVIEEIEKDIVLSEENIPEKVRGWCTEFFRCSGCGKIYWRGSHYDSMIKLFSNLHNKT